PPNEPNYLVPVHITFADCVLGLYLLLSIFIINLIDKDRVHRGKGFGNLRTVCVSTLFPLHGW
ncbi:hypothetical protein EI94DRAFT_1429612, partial [Lactarius quietus]